MKLITLHIPSVATRFDFTVPAGVQTLTPLDIPASQTAGFTRYGIGPSEPPTLLLNEKLFPRLVAIQALCGAPQLTIFTSHAQTIAAHWAYPTLTMGVPYPPSHLGLQLVLPCLPYGYPTTLGTPIPIWLSPGNYTLIFEGIIIHEELATAPVEVHPPNRPIYYNIADQKVGPLSPVDTASILTKYDAQPFHPYFGPAMIT